MTDPPLIEDLIHRLAVQTMAYPYKVWGYGEEIGLLAASDVTSEPAYFEFVHDLMDAWVASRPVISYPDHVAPGSVLPGNLPTNRRPAFVRASTSLGPVFRRFAARIVGDCASSP